MKKILRELKRRLGFCEAEGCYHLAVRQFTFKRGKEFKTANLCDDCGWKAYEDPDNFWPEEDEEFASYITDYFKKHPKRGKRKM